MALIGKIRKNSWLLIVLIGLGLASFIIMDMFSGNQGAIGGGNINTVGKVNGQEIGMREFTNAEKIQQFLYGSNANDGGFGRRNAIWNYFVEDAIVREMADDLGLNVSKEELIDLQFGPNPSPVIRARFIDPNTGQYDPTRVASFKTALDDGTLSQDPNWGPVWAYQEKEIIKDRLQSKINAMITKGLYTPTWMVEKVGEDQNKRVDFEYVQIPFDELDTDVELTDSDYQAYLENNKAQYMQEEETRKVDYVVFDVVPTRGDSNDIRKQVTDLIPSFRTTESDSQFITNNFGFIADAYFSKEDMATFDQAIVDSLFKVDQGTVIGPYIDANAYRAIKLLDRKVIADSVRSRHILRRVDPNSAATNPMAMIQANATIDSLKQLLENGAEVFDSLAAKYSQDYSNSNNGGDLGYSAINATVQPYNNVLFYTGEIGKLYKVTTQFGVHLIEVLDRKFETNEERVKIAYLNQPIIPSEATQNAVRKKAREFVAENRSLDAIKKAAAETDGLEVETAYGLKENDYIVGALGSGTDSRQIIKWTYKASEGEVSPDVYSYQDQVNYFDNKYVVVGLSGIVDPGMPSVADIKEEIEIQVANQKKAEKVKSQLSGSNLAAIAAQYNSEVDTVRSVSFTSSSIPGLGNEPKVLASAFNLDLNQMSEPIIGNSGVYLLKVYNKPESTGVTNIPQIRQIENTKTQSQIRGNLIQAMKKNAQIEDYRSRFY